jgi:triacylglycerol lipase
MIYSNNRNRPDGNFIFNLTQEDCMARVTLTLIFTVFLAVPSILSAAGTAKNACETKYPIVLAHGMGTQAKVMQFIDYWGGITTELEENGGEVYITSVNAMDSTANKGLAWKRQVLEILAVTGKAKVNVIGHSHGALYTRYAISNLGLGPQVASHTSIAGPHRGSCVAEMILGIIPDTMEPLVGDMLNTLMSFVMGDVNGDTVSNGYDLTRSYMINTFNPNTPDVSGVYYQSYAYKVNNIIGGGPIFSITWLAMLPIEGANDVLVSVDSAKWGNFKGVISGSAGGIGVNHLAAIGLLSGILYPPVTGYDAPEFFAGIASDLKSRGM